MINSRSYCALSNNNNNDSNYLSENNSNYLIENLIKKNDFTENSNNQILPILPLNDLNSLDYFINLANNTQFVSYCNNLNKSCYCYKLNKELNKIFEQYSKYTMLKSHYALYCKMCDIIHSHCNSNIRLVVCYAHFNKLNNYDFMNDDSIKKGFSKQEILDHVQTMDCDVISFVNNIFKINRYLEQDLYYNNLIINGYIDCFIKCLSKKNTFIYNPELVSFNRQKLINYLQKLLELTKKNSEFIENFVINSKKVLINAICFDFFQDELSVLIPKAKVNVVYDIIKYVKITNTDNNYAASIVTYRKKYINVITKCSKVNFPKFDHLLKNYNACLEMNTNKMNLDNARAKKYDYKPDLAINLCESCAKN